MKKKSAYIKARSNTTTLEFDIGIISNRNRLVYRKMKNHYGYFSDYTTNSVKDRQKDDLIKMLSIADGDINVLSQLVSESVFNDCEYMNFSLSGIKATRAAFVFTDLRGCNFSNSILKGCDFTFANLQNCNFTDALIENCNFRHANLKNANFQGVHSVFSDFTGAEFSR